MDSLLRWILVGVMLLGAPFVAIGGCEAIGTERELRRSARAVGVVVGNRLVVDQHDGVEEHAFQPTVEFRDTAGGVRRFTDPAASLPPDYAVGEAVAVAFDEREPAHARIVSWKRLWLVPTLLTSIGLLPSLVCWVVFRRLSRA
jgi:hypothetical protein